jgi:hypothetical protein
MGASISNIVPIPASYAKLPSPEDRDSVAFKDNQVLPSDRGTSPTKNATGLAEVDASLVAMPIGPANIGGNDLVEAPRAAIDVPPLSPQPVAKSLEKPRSHWYALTKEEWETMNMICLVIPDTR